MLQSFRKNKRDANIKIKMIVVIRIKGIVDIPKDVKRTLDMLKLRKKHACVMLSEKPEILGMLKKVQSYVAFGNLDKETFKLLLLKRGKLLGDNPLEIKEEKLDSFIEDFFNSKAKLSDIKLKPFFRLHPPKGGFKKSTKIMWPKGILGNHHNDINKLIIRML